MPHDISADKAATGIAGLDAVLNGGFERNRVYLIEGTPGSGKTTVGLQFLLDGARRGEPGLYITLSETADELTAAARSHAWSLDGIDVFELVPPEAMFDDAQQQSLLYSADLELGETMRLVFERIERTHPSRIVFDSLSEIRLLAQGSLRYRRQILALKHYLTRQDATVLLLDDRTSEAHDLQLHSLAHGIVHLEQLAPEYGAERRRLRVLKYRGARYRGGFHDFTIQTGGVAVFPRLIAAEHDRGTVAGSVASGIAQLDMLLGGGLERGTSTLIVGPAGAGKSLLALHYAVAAIRTGGRAAIYVFDEEVRLYIARALTVGLDLESLRAAGRLAIHQIDAAELSPGEFAHTVWTTVERDGVDTVVIDSLNGYQAAMPGEQFLVLHMHELLAYLNRRGVLSMLLMAQHGLIGAMQSPVDVTYLSDAVILLRYFEAAGRVRRAISVIKKRGGAHEDAIRELQVSARGLSVGEPLHAFKGVLTGVPTYSGDGSPLLHGSEV